MEWNYNKLKLHNWRHRRRSWYSQFILICIFINPFQIWCQFWAHDNSDCQFLPERENLKKNFYLTEKWPNFSFLAPFVLCLCVFVMQEILHTGKKGRHSHAHRSLFGSITLHPFSSIPPFGSAHRHHGRTDGQMQNGAARRERKNRRRKEDISFFCFLLFSS